MKLTLLHITQIEAKKRAEEAAARQQLDEAERYRPLTSKEEEVSHLLSLLNVTILIFLRLAIFSNENCCVHVSLKSYFLRLSVMHSQRVDAAFFSGDPEEVLAR